MERQGEEVHVEADEARGGSTPNTVRWILGISLLLAIIAMSAVWIIPALMQSESEREATVSDRIENVDDGDGTDSILLGGASDTNTAEGEIAGEDIVTD